MTFGPVRELVDRGRRTYRNFAIGLYAAAAAVVAITAWLAGRDFYRAGPMVLVALLVGLGALYHVWYRRLGWSRHPVLIALETDPVRIISAEVTTEGLALLGNDRHVAISTADASVLLSFHKDQLPALVRALRDHCSEIELVRF